MGFDDALPFVKHGGSISADMRLGWRPKGDTFVAPIPLYYEFGDTTDYVEGKMIYLGPRYNNSIKVHQAFACRTIENDKKSYSYKFPANILTLKGKKTENPRSFLGMNPRVLNSMNGNGSPSKS